MGKFSKGWLIVSILVCLGSVSGFGQSGALTGAGSTFVNPLMSKWSKEYHTLHPKIEINYQSIGSGGGRQQFLAKTVAFGASDAPLTDEQIAQAGGAANVVHIPVTQGSVVLSPTTCLAFRSRYGLVPKPSLAFSSARSRCGTIRKSPPTILAFPCRQGRYWWFTDRTARVRPISLPITFQRSARNGSQRLGAVRPCSGRRALAARETRASPTR